MLNKIMFQDANYTQIGKPPVLVLKRAQFSLLSDFPRNIDTCQRKQTCSARLIGKNSAEGSFAKLAPVNIFSNVKFIYLTL